MRKRNTFQNPKQMGLTHKSEDILKLITLVKIWRECFIKTLNELDSFRVNSDAKKDLLDKFDTNVVADSTRALRNNPDVDPEKLVNMLELFKDFRLDIRVAANILQHDPNLDLNIMSHAVRNLEAKFLEVRDNLPIEFFSEYSIITEKFYDEVFVSVANVLKANAEKRINELKENKYTDSTHNKFWKKSQSLDTFINYLVPNNYKRGR